MNLSVERDKGPKGDASRTGCNHILETVFYRERIPTAFRKLTDRKSVEGVKFVKFSVK